MLLQAETHASQFPEGWFAHRLERERLSRRARLTYFEQLHGNDSKNELQKVSDQHNIAYGFESYENTSNNGLWCEEELAVK